MPEKKSQYRLRRFKAHSTLWNEPIYVEAMTERACKEFIFKFTQIASDWTVNEIFDTPPHTAHFFRA